MIEGGPQGRLWSIRLDQAIDRHYRSLNAIVENFLELEREGEAEYAAFQLSPNGNGGVTLQQKN